MFDGSQIETSKLCAMVFCTINDFSAHGNLSVSYPNFVRGPLLDDMRPFFGPREVLGTHH